MQKLKKPISIRELEEFSRFFSGKSLHQVAKELHYVIPTSLQRDKGWVGKWLEQLLGSTSGSRAEQDFPELGVELKTIPITPRGVPLESTFVCFAPLIGWKSLAWKESTVYKKLHHVLWLPLIGTRTLPVGQRVIGTPLLWKPSSDEEHRLKQDWEELTSLIVLGHSDTLTGHYGEVLQLRPKGPHRYALTRTINELGKIIFTQPRGFYLRKSFTESIMKTHFSC